VGGTVERMAAGASSSGPALAQAVAAGRFVLTTSIGTLPAADEPLLRSRLGQVRDAFGFVKFGDNPRARARVSPWAAAAVAIAEGLEPIVHVGCRDRNRLALQSDLLGGQLLGVPNVLCLRGDEIEVSDQPGTAAVHDVDVVDLVRLASRERAFFVLAACDPAVPPTGAHLERLRAKLSAGAGLLETQPVFDGSRFAAWLTRARDAGIDAPVLVDVSVAATPREAELLERIPYVQPPPRLAERVRADPQSGIALAAEIVAEVRDMPGVAGCHLSRLGGDPAPTLAVLDRLR
jgi:5,10-methylenetetrahydrofolate reductase